jgi:hypothetical protein
MGELEEAVCIQKGSSARASNATAASDAAAMRRRGRRLRYDFNLHLLRADVVSDVFCCDGDGVVAGFEP